MTTQEVIEKAELVLKMAGVTKLPPQRTFLEYASLVAEAARALTPKQIEGFPNFKEWALGLRKLHDQFDVLLAKDPMLAYRPANRASLEFHSSAAYARYFMAGNRTSKTQSGYAEHYLITTGQHKWRPFNPPPASTFIIGVNFSQYAGAVFEKKFFLKEDDNPISPMFPIGGKWFYHYDERKHLLQIACPACAEADKGGSCPHPKSSIRLFSDEGGWEVLQGAQYLMGHFDEHVDEGFYNEARQRTKTVTGGCLIVTGTPLNGTEAWEVRRLYNRFLAGGKENYFDPENSKSGPYVTVHQIDQFEAGLVPHDKIRADMADMDEFSIQARIFGKPAPLADNPVFDLHKLQEIKNKYAKKPKLGRLQIPDTLENLKPDSEIKFIESKTGELRIWKKPEEGIVYICAVDAASGLQNRYDKNRRGDASCASILKVSQNGTKVALELVAQWHGWINPLSYAAEIFKVCVFYNSALAVVELTGGLGLAVVLKLKDEYFYWNLYRERADFSQINPTLDPRIGVDTNAATKPFMVAALQLFVREDRIIIPDEATLQELVAFEEEKQGRDGKQLASPRFRGAKGSPDDRAMSLVIGASVANSYPPLLYSIQSAEEEKRAKAVRDPFWQELYRDLKRPTIEEL